MQRFLFPMILVLLLAGCAKPVDYVLIDKSDERMYLYKGPVLVDSFDVTFGKNPAGHKQHEGDGRTPEGYYSLDFKNPNSRYTQSIRISYPNESDVMRAQSRGLPPGGDIFIHGQPTGKNWGAYDIQKQNWTDGCVAMRNQDMAAFWDLIYVPVPIEIRP